MDNYEAIFKKDDKYDLIELNGIINIDNSISFQYDIDANLNYDKIILIDMLYLQYVDSSGVSIFIELSKSLQKNNHSLYAFNLNEKVANLFKLIGINKYIKILDMDAIKKIIH